MTDDTHDHEAQDAHADPGYESGAEAGGETWHGEPVDDFSDDPAGATVSEEHDETAESVEPRKRRGKLVPTIIVVGGVVFLGTMLYMQFGGALHDILNKSSQSVVAAHQAVPSERADIAPKTSLATVAASNSVASATEQKGVAMPMAASTVAAGSQTPVSVPAEATKVANIGSAAPAAAEAATVPAPVAAASITPAAPAAPVAAETPAAVAAAPAPVAEKTPSPVMPMAAAISSAAPAAVSSSAPAPVAAVQTPQAGSLSEDARLGALASRVDTLQKSLEQITQQLGQMSDKLASVQSAGGGAEAASALEDRLSRLERKLAHGDAAATTKEAPAADLSLASENTAGAVAAPVVHKTTARVVHHKPVEALSHKIAKAKHKHVAAAAPVKWVLRAASADQAWVAKNATTPELRPVHVGDDLPGIGRVMSIHEVDGGWEVVGTSGSVR